MLKGELIKGNAAKREYDKSHHQTIKLHPLKQYSKTGIKHYPTEMLRCIENYYNNTSCHLLINVV